MGIASRCVVTLLALALLASVAAAQTVRDYDIVYVRQARFGDDVNTIWPEVFHPARMDPGADLMLLREDGSEAAPNELGALVLCEPFPCLARTVWGDHARYEQTYLKQITGHYAASDAALFDRDGQLWVTGRLDDVINVAGHRLGTMELEAALLTHVAVSEAAVVGYPHDLKGQGIYCYVTLMAGVDGSDELRNELVKHVRNEIGPIASPDKLQFAPSLPKTRSGKIMRRILRKIAEDDFGALGDTSTLADPSVVDDLIANRQNRRS